MKNTKLPGRVLSGVLACALTLTMTPSAAFATDDVAASEDAVAPIEQEADEQVADELPNIHTEEVPVEVAVQQPAEEEPEPQAQESAPQVAPEEIEMIKSSVVLDEKPATILSYNGMNFRINPDASDTVALVGISSAATDNLVIPGQIHTSTGTLAVTEIVGGGSLNP